VNLTARVAIGPGICRRAHAFLGELLKLFGGRLIPARARDIAAEAGMSEQTFGDYRLRHGAQRGVRE
jgi:hypothetical protein